MVGWKINLSNTVFYYIRLNELRSTKFVIKFITKHRRGTQLQWSRSEVIPEKGEIIIIDPVLEGDVPRLKVGDGEHKYKDLPYIDEKLSAKLVEEILGVNVRINNLTALAKDTGVDLNTPEGQLQDMRAAGMLVVDAEEGDPGYQGNYETAAAAVRSIRDELTEIREATGDNTAGEAVKSINEDLIDLRGSLQQFIDGKAVGGLIYEDNLLQLADVNGDPVGDPVEIKGGSGGGSSTSVRLINNNGSSSLSFAKDSPAILKFTFTSVEDGIPTGDGICTVAVGGETKASFNIKQGESRVDVSPYLNVGTNNVKITCTDQYGGYRSLAYVLTVIELSITSTFDATVPYTSDITFKSTPVGIITKTIHYVIDGEEVASAVVTSSGKQITQILKALPHGVHRLDVYATADLNDVIAESNHLLYDVISVRTGETAAMIASVYQTTEIEQSEQISIPYIVYDPSKLTAEITRRITYLKDGEETLYAEDTLEVDRSQQYWTTRSYPTGTVTFTIIYDYNWSAELNKYLGHTEVSHTIKVSAAEIDIQPETNDLVVHLSSKDRSNNEKDPARWENNGITTTFKGFNWKSNGWVTDENGDSCLRINGDARAEINLKLFSEDFKRHGKTIELEFVVHDVNNRDAVVIDCMSGGIGLKATADTATFSSQSTNVKCNYRDETRVRVSFTIEDAGEQSNRLMSVYLDGIVSGVQQYPATDNFEQLTPVTIRLGSSLCGLDLYTIRVYDTALTPLQMVHNYIADIPNINEKIKVYNANDIYDEFLRLSYDKLKTRIPVVTLTGDLPKYKGDKKKNSVMFKFEDPFHPELNFEDLISSIDVQGTSSQFYVRKNWKVKFKNKHQHMVGEIPAKVFCMKVDYAESTGTHNTQAANFIETLYSEKIPPQFDDPRCRSTIEGFPCIIFEKATEDSEPVFASKANFNYDKGASNVYGLSSDYDTESWEFCNNTSGACNFTGPLVSTARWCDDFEPRYIPNYTNSDGTITEEPFDELDDLESKEADASITLTDEQRARLAELRVNLIARFKKVHDWVVSTKDDKDKFRNEFEKYFDMHFSCIYYVFTFFALMTDQRAKNMFLTYWNPEGTEDGGRWYPYFYDNDTIFGINNEGALVFDYYHEDTDKLGSSYVFNGQQSVLWNNFRECFADRIQQTYKDLRDSGKLTYEKIIDRFVHRGSDAWCENVYNEDANYKYISIINEPDPTGKTWGTSQLYQVRGSGKNHLEYFVKNRLNYCDSKWNVGDYRTNYIFMRIYTPVLAEGQTLPVPANPNITITPFSNMYAGVIYKANGTLLQKRLSKNEVYTFEPPLQPDGTPETFNDTETAIYGANQISSIGDLSGLYCGVIDVSAASKLVELIVGNHTEGYTNDNFREISLGTNRLLKRLDLTNCTGLGKHAQTALDLTGCPNIESVEALGTSLLSVNLPDSGYLRKLHLPGTINNLNIKNQLYIEDFILESYKNIRTLCIDNCPTLDTVSMLEKCKTGDQYTVDRVRLTGISWNLENIEFLRTLYGLKGLDENGQNTDSAYLIGTCHIKELTGAEMKEINEHFPYLTITFDTLRSQLIFMDANGQELTAARQEILNGGNGIEPVENGLISTPYKRSTAQYDYTWTGWSRKNGETEEPQEDAVYNVLADRTLYPTFSRKVRSYLVRFYNGTELIYSTYALYGDDAAYAGSTPAYELQKPDTGSPEAFEFASWEPSPENIQGPTNCYAQYYIKDDAWYHCLLSDFIYNASSAEQRIDITGYKGTKTVIKIEDSYKPNGTTDCNVISITGFAGVPIELIELPSTLKSVGPEAFADCVKLEQLTLPASLESVAEWSFKGCTSLKTVNYNAVNLRTVGEGSSGAAAIARAPFAASGNSEGFDLNIGKDVTEIPPMIFYQYNPRNDAPTIKSLRFEQDSKCTSFGYNSFRGCNIKSIEIPSSLKTIGSYALYQNYYVEDLELPEGLTSIGDQGLQKWTALKHIKLPSTLQTVGTAFLADASSLESIDLAEGNRNFILRNQCLIRNKDKRLMAGNKNSVIPTDGSILSINEYAFSGCTGLTTVEVPEGITEIRPYTFNECTSLTSVSLPSTLTTIGSLAFYHCPVEMSIPDSVSTIQTYAFANAKFKSLTLPTELTSLGTAAFFANEDLTEVVMGDKVRTIAPQAFQNCRNLKTITLSKGLIEIGEEGARNIFTGCNKLEVINAPFAEGAILGAPWGAPSSVRINYNYKEDI